MDGSLNFVLCPSFHGATLLSILLNNHPDIVALGDTVPHAGQICSCGDKVEDCTFWSEVFKGLGDFKQDTGWAIPVLPELGSPRLNRYLLLALAGVGITAGSKAANLLGGTRIKSYLAAHAKFRELVTEISDKRIFVDGQKSITKTLLHRAYYPKDVPVRVIHLVRDPRGFLNSCRKRFPEISTQTASKQWNSHNHIDLLKKHFHIEQLVVQYEKLCTSPKSELDRVFSFLNVRSENVCHTPTTHAYHVVGNRMIKKFDGEIILNTAWKKNLSKKEQREILFQTKRKASLFGYNED